MNKNSLRTYLSSSYQGAQSFLEHIIYPIFGEEHFVDEYEAEILTNQPEYEGLATAAGIQSIKQVGKVYVGVEPLQIFDITVGSQVQMARNRVGIQQLIRRIMDTHSLAFMLFHYEDGGAESQESWEWRFTFCHKGASQTDTTSSKRFTFLLGPGQHCRTATDNFQRLIDKRGAVEVKDIEDAFSVEALNKEFFDKYRQHYATFVEYITGKRYVKQGGKWEEKQVSEPNAQLRDQFCDDEKRVRDYVKKLLGRIVFLHYLQRKGWLGVPSDKAWGDGDRSFIQHLYEYATEAQQSDFITSVLSPLFYEALNTDRRADNDLFDTRVKFPKRGNKLRIPYLNGGLFDRDENAALLIKFPPEFFKDLLDFFAQYNFTIDENDPTDAQVGVDPEMLGRIFESLLEDNKEKGAYYTPKEIVQYMCRESLIAYLCTGIDQGTPEHQAISQFVKSYDAELLLGLELEGVELGTKVLERLKEVKVCDPAIGSGAFPMGMLRELYYCRISLEDLSVSPAEIKSQIIKGNIYGVDIEQGAVDIARLRFWLSLVVDETTPTPLPNLDYKIMQGNSLLEWYEGVDLSTLTQRKEDGCVELFDDLADVYRRQLRQAISDYYGETDHKRKATLHKKISQAIDEQLKEQHYTVNLSGINVSANTHFFLWHTWFNEVFNRPSGRNGFDIVIGNPPYLRIQGLKSVDPSLVDALKALYKSADASFDLYVPFIELGLSLVSECGSVNYIAPTKWSNADFGKGLRALLCSLSAAARIINFSDYQVFNASTYSGIQTFQRGSERLYYTQLAHDLDTSMDIKLYLDSLKESDFTPIDYKQFKKQPWILATNQVYQVLLKLKQQPLTLGDVFDKVYQGIATSKDNVFFLYDVSEISDTVIEGYSMQLGERVQVEKGLVKPLLKGEDVHRYDDIKTNRCVIFPYKLGDMGACLYEETEIARVFPLGYKYLKSCEDVLRGRENGRFNIDGRWYQFGRGQGIAYSGIPKLLAPEISLGGNFAYDRNGHFYHTTKVYGYIKKPESQYSYQFLLGLLNSRLFWFFIQNTGYVLRGGYYTFKTNYVTPFPIPRREDIEDADYTLVESSVQEILEGQKAAPQINTLLLVIDKTICKIYGVDIPLTD
ncbi:TaqI-like C-terminal specificity domain-containing protein [uncultured Porphyromonas sp.]|uniref:Eco57I restriction-modification methylase domain-containing protein n=1 Tax=uncultured Porphyromonas sp. TaxID=159274 RepID=UPI00261763CA|nr:TaqI-like C-terminal specificity domain-containing protein [uncultured Porphyromonas sp.]